MENHSNSCKAGSYIKQSNPSSLDIWVNPHMKITTTKELVYRYGLCGRKKVGVSSPMNMWPDTETRTSLLRTSCLSICVKQMYLFYSSHPFSWYIGYTDLSLAFLYSELFTTLFKLWLIKKNGHHQELCTFCGRVHFGCILDSCARLKSDLVFTGKLNTVYRDVVVPGWYGWESQCHVSTCLSYNIQMLDQRLFWVFMGGCFKLVSNTVTKYLRYST